MYHTTPLYSRFRLPSPASSAGQRLYKRHHLAPLQQRPAGVAVAADRSIKNDRLSSSSGRRAADVRAPLLNGKSRRGASLVRRDRHSGVSVRHDWLGVTGASGRNTAPLCRTWRTGSVVMVTARANSQQAWAIIARLGYKYAYFVWARRH